MIFTIGHTETYKRNLAEAAAKGIPLMKVGRRHSYAGGSVWKTRKQAQRHLDSKGMTSHSVYGVKANWTKDTVQRPDVPWRDLLRDAEIVELSQECGAR